RTRREAGRDGGIPALASRFRMKASMGLAVEAAPAMDGGEDVFNGWSDHQAVLSCPLAAVEQARTPNVIKVREWLRMALLCPVVGTDVRLVVDPVKLVLHGWLESGG
ncbi:hypothetical protein OAJ60_03825, partial [Planctomycetaceae bacterium]|nr:hypothetical protein [Planctomycetaceae bacterium]